MAILTKATLHFRDMNMKKFSPCIGTKKVNHISNKLVRWIRPDIDFVKINFDGSLYPGKSAAGFVIRNQMGDFYMQVLTELKLQQCLKQRL